MLLALRQVPPTLPMPFTEYRTPAVYRFPTSLEMTFTGCLPLTMPLAPCLFATAANLSAPHDAAQGTHLPC